MLEQIRTLQDYGFGLEETRPFVECLRAGHPAGDTCAASLAVYRSKLAEMDAWVDRLTAVRAEVAAQLLRAERERGQRGRGGPAPPGTAVRTDRRSGRAARRGDFPP